MAFEALFQRLAQSPFRQRFHLGYREYVYSQSKGAAALSEHATAFINERLAAAEPAHDGKQTPMRGHPVFIAQHATATCCRGCIEKWHALPRHQPLTAAQQDYLVSVIMHWLHHEMQRPIPPAPTPKSAATSAQLSLW